MPPRNDGRVRPPFDFRLLYIYSMDFGMGAYSPVPSSQVDMYSGFSYSSAWLVRFKG
jgi:hypothetical protein